MQLDWFQSGTKFRPKPKVKWYKEYQLALRAAVKAGDLIAIREAQGQLVARVLQAENPKAVPEELDMLQVREAMEQLEAECWPRPPARCPNCNYDLAETNEEDADRPLEHSKP